MIHFILGTVLLAIAGIHFYWAFGGKKSSKGVFPEIENFNTKPSPLATIIVALVFLGMAVYYFLYPNFLPRWGSLVLGFVFLIRSIGDFKYLGFFKSKKTGLFAEYDSKYYSPLCLILGILNFLLFYL